MDRVRKTSRRKTGRAETDRKGRGIIVMPIYIYETINPSKPVRRFELKQSMKDEPLRVDPETGEPVKRVISGGFGVHVPGGSTGPSVGSVGSHGCGPGCSH